MIAARPDDFGDAAPADDQSAGRARSRHPVRATVSLAVSLVRAIWRRAFRCGAVILEVESTEPLAEVEPDGDLARFWHSRPEGFRVVPRRSQPEVDDGVIGDVLDGLTPSHA